MMIGDNMKYRIIALITMLLIVVASVVFVVIKQLNTKEIESIKTLNMRSNSGFANFYTFYSIECNNKCFVRVINTHPNTAGNYSVEISEKDVNKIVKVLQKYNVKSWDGFDKSDKYVLDGSSYSFDLTTKEGLKVSAKGYMKYPDGYHEVISEIEKIISDIKPESNINYYANRDHTYYDDYKNEVMIIDSNKELDAFEKVFGKYIISPVVHFEEDTVFVKLVPASSGSIDRTITNVRISDSKLIFEVDESAPKYGTDDMVTWYYIAVVPNNKAKLINTKDFIRPSSIEIDTEKDLDE